MIFSIFLVRTSRSQCFKEIDEDICSQREGFDTNCDSRCTQIYGSKLRSECRARQTGTLLSFFGIRSFICRCELASIFCTNPQLAQHQPFHHFVIQQHSVLTPIKTPVKKENLCKRGSNFLTCRDNFASPRCSWQLSNNFEWFGATPKDTNSGSSPFGANFLAGKGGELGTVSTCDGLCSKSSMNLTARVWRSKNVVVELCFKENEAIMCAPVHSSNGALINEILPETEHFQISLKFSNITSPDEMVLIDDLSLNFTACSKNIPAPKLKSKLHSDSSMISGSIISRQKTQQIFHYAFSHCTISRGRAGLSYCRQKCKALEGAENSARCLRQKENPVLKKCVCQVRRSPQIKKIDGPEKEPTEEKPEEIPEILDNKIHDDEVTVSTTTVSTTVPQVSATCQESKCSFEKDTDCDWADLRMLSKHFNNISVAMKKGDENRYGISRLRPKSYSGLLHKTSLTGPIQMSIDIFPSHVIDVRICVQNLRKCQTQTISARSWNRVSAKIKVQTTEKVFVLFYNGSADDTKSIAIDNISIRAGPECFSSPT
ncbi:unnamed protein product [Caenorhabditis angaria]|uniref:MAM domain-containing protein n=1 Tax=Caenorhabditis angaria TaxID=860376 RepID=A0A9P1IRA1_9PELO|nr:unnamed protein product [Caenorhabditis angaria]